MVRVWSNWTGIVTSSTGKHYLTYIAFRQHVHCVCFRNKYFTQTGLSCKNMDYYVVFGVLTAVVMKNFGGICLHLQGRRISLARNWHEARSKQSSACCLFRRLTFNGLLGIIFQKIELFMDRYFPNNMCIDKMSQKVHRFVYDSTEHCKAHSVSFLTRLNYDTVIKYPIICALMRFFLAFDVIHWPWQWNCQTWPPVVDVDGATCLCCRTRFILPMRKVHGSDLSRDADYSNYLMGCDAVYSGRTLPAFRGNVLPPCVQGERTASILRAEEWVKQAVSLKNFTSRISWPRFLWFSSVPPGKLGHVRFLTLSDSLFIIQSDAV
jgi:hypothetical protein